MSEQRILKSMCNFSLKRIGSKLFKAFIADGGDNYLELNFIHSATNQHYSVTVKPTEGMTQGHKNELLENRIEELQTLCRECADYLDYNKHTNIGHNSVFHILLRDKGGAK